MRMVSLTSFMQRSHTSLKLSTNIDLKSPNLDILMMTSGYIKDSYLFPLRSVKNRQVGITLRPEVQSAQPWDKPCGKDTWALPFWILDIWNRLSQEFSAWVAVERFEDIPYYFRYPLVHDVSACQRESAIVLWCLDSLYLLHLDYTMKIM